MSAKYKGAFCEAQVRSVVKQVKCRVTFKHGLGSTTLSDEYVRRAGGGARDEGGAGVLQVGATVLARHPDRQEYLEAVLNKIQASSTFLGLTCRWYLSLSSYHLFHGGPDKKSISI